MARISPTERTLDLYREQGFHVCSTSKRKKNAPPDDCRGFVQVVEKWVGPLGPAGKRVDLFGFIDVLVVDGSGFLGVQVTGGSNVSARLKKIQTECLDVARFWLGIGGRIEIQGWRKVKRDGRLVYRPRILAVTENELGGEEEEGGANPNAGGTALA